MINELIQQALADAQTDGVTVAAGFVAAVVVIKSVKLMAAAASNTASRKLATALESVRSSAAAFYRDSLARPQFMPSPSGQQWHAGTAALVVPSAASSGDSADTPWPSDDEMVAYVQDMDAYDLREAGFVGPSDD